MIDFEKAKVFKLSKCKNFTHADLMKPLLVNGEEFIAEYQALRDFVIFTNKRIVAVNVQGFTGAKKDFTSLPYSKIQAFSVETAGKLDLDAELEMYFSGLGKVKFEFSQDSSVIEISKLIAEKIL